MALVSLCLVLSIFGYGTYMAKEQADLIHQDMEQEMVGMAQNLAAIGAHFMVTGDFAGLESAASRFAARSGIASLLVTDPSGKPIAELINKNGQWSPIFTNEIVAVPQTNKPVLQNAIAALDGNSHAAWHPIEAGSLLGWARVSFAPPGFGQLVYHIWMQSLWVVALACTLALALLAALLRPSLRALEDATRFARTLDQDRGQKLTPYADGAEFGALGNALNAASDRLRSGRQELESALVAAEAGSVAKSLFLATVSHELRTPMNGILGMAQMLLMPNIKDDERQDYARIILNSGQTLMALLNDILDISKVEAGKLELESAALDPAQIIHEIQTLFAAVAGHKGLRIESGWLGATGQSDQPDQRYLGDPHRLRQILSNLVGNALKFTEKGHIRIEAREVERDGAHALLEFSVTDTGIGIPEEKQALLFKAFSQTDSSTTRQYGGTGLGLSIVRSLAKLMGGDVGVESEVGRGSSFWFRIRADLLAPGADSRDEVRQATAGMRSGTFSGHILVVDDNPTNRLVLKAMLSKPGVRCDFVEDGRQAVEAITGGMAPDLVLMDCQMPVMDGYEATLQIRRWETETSRPRLTIVALTASAFEDDRKRCQDVGMDDFLAKPVDIEKLTAMLGHWLAGGSSGTAETDRAPRASIPTQGDGPLAFDEKILLSQLGGDRELAEAVIVSATDDIPGYFDQLEQAIAAGNWMDAERKTHTLKGLTAQIGGIRLSTRMKALDDHLKGGGDTDSATVAALRTDYHVLSDTLARWMASPAKTIPAPSGKLVGIDPIVATYRELDALLSQNKFDAIGRFKELQVLVAGTETSAEVVADIAEAGRVMTEFRFDLAREHLHRIAARQGWETTTS